MKKKIVLFVAGLALATAVIGSASSTSHAMMPLRNGQQPSAGNNIKKNKKR